MNVKHSVYFWILFNCIYVILLKFAIAIDGIMSTAISAYCFGTFKTGHNIAMRPVNEVDGRYLCWKLTC